MAVRVKLVEKVVRSAEPRADKWQIFDEEIRGFALVVYPSGSRAFALSYRHAGRQRRIIIGGWPEWSAAAAREHAKHLRREIDAGRDPVSERAAAREVPRVCDLIDKYVEHHLPRLAPRNAADQLSMLRKLVEPEWRNRLVPEITPGDVEKLLTRVAAGRARPHKQKPKNRRRRPLAPPRPTPVRANRLGEVLRKMFGLAIKPWKMRDDNPAADFHRRVETERERYLSPAEIDRLAAALAACEDQRGPGIVRLLLLTGARLAEVRCARFEQFNLHLQVWAKPAATTKQRRTHRLPVSEDVCTLVRLRRAEVPGDCPWLFPGDVEGKPLQDIRRFWRSTLKAADLEGLRLHDLRHTFASLLAGGGASLQLIGKLLGHTQVRTTQRYAHLVDEALRAGVESVSAEVMPRLRLVR